MTQLQKQELKSSCCCWFLCLYQNQYFQAFLVDQGPRDLQESSGLSRSIRFGRLRHPACGLSNYLWLSYPAMRDSYCWVNLTAEVTQPPGPSNYQVLNSQAWVCCPLCSPGWPVTRYKDQAVFKLIEMCISVSHVLGLRVCITMPILTNHPPNH